MNGSEHLTLEESLKAPLELIWLWFHGSAKEQELEGTDKSYYCPVKVTDNGLRGQPYKANIET